MKYLTGVSNASVTDLRRSDLGLMLQPKSGYESLIPLYPFFAMDCGAYGGKFNTDQWRRMLDKGAEYGELCLFAVCPDRFDPNDLSNNHRLTLEQWHVYRDEVWDRGLRAAFVVQNGCTPDDVPPEADAVFIGGDTAYKLSEVAWAVVACAKAHGMWAHVGRVNSMKRIRACSLSMADSADGTFLKHAPDYRLPDLTGWLDKLEEQPHLPIFGARPE